MHHVLFRCLSFQAAKRTEMPSPALGTDLEAKILHEVLFEMLIRTRNADSSNAHNLLGA